MAADPVKVDPKHYKVDFENDKVRVLRIRYGPREKSAMHGHPEGVIVFLTDCDGKFTYPDGKTEPIQAKAGETVWSDQTEHLPENVSNEPLEVLLVELKS